MAKLKFSGPLSLRLKSFLAINSIAITTYLRHVVGKGLAKDWDANIEIGIRFWRHQFSAALRQENMDHGRLLFDSLQTETDDIYDVTTSPCTVPRGDWYTPNGTPKGPTILYFHGGGYTFHGGVSKRFAAMLSHRMGCRLFAPDYRLTPEHSHPAQSQDALAAWTHLTQTIPAEEIVVIGDSAGGHMALMLLQTLREHEREQPALCVGLCPWTDIGERGTSLRANNRFDLVQGWMALQFGEWLDPNGQFGREALSPINYDFKGLAPIYLQTGSREILHDMIVEFAEIQRSKGADISIDIWPDMPHNFQAYDSLKSSSAEALKKLKEAISRHAAG